MFPQNQMPNTQNATSTAQTNQANGADEEQVEVNPDEVVKVVDQSKDINIVPPPPKAGDYIFQWSTGEKGVEYRASKKAGTFIVVPLEGHLVLEGSEYNGYRVLDWLNSIYSQLKGTTPVHDYLYKIGVAVPAEASQKMLKETVESTLAQKPYGTATLEWRVSERNPADPRANKDGYVVLKNRMDQFPRLPDGSFQNWIESKLDGSKLYAQAYVAAHLKK